MTDRPTWDVTWMQIAKDIGQRSRCSRDQVGAVIVSADNRVIATGYNGPPANFSIDKHAMCRSFCPRAKLDQALTRSSDYKDCVAIHAEMNAILCTTRDQMLNAHLYVNSPVCWNCAKVIANSGINSITMLDDLDKAAARGSADTNEFLMQCGIALALMDKDGMLTYG